MIDIRWDFPDFEDKLRRNRERIQRFVAATLQTNRGMIFDREGAYNGRNKWAALKFRQGMILSKTGHLRKSIAPRNANGRAGPDGIVRFQGDTVTIGTNLYYARLMNDGTTKLPGGVLRPVKAKALKIPIPQGKWAGEGADDLQGEHFKKKIDALHKRIRELKEHKLTPTRKKQIEKLQGQIVKLSQQRGEGKSPVKFIFRKSVKIPERRFDDWTPQDEEELEVALRNVLEEILNE